MNTRLLQENKDRRKELPLGWLLCFVMFCVWQMGIVYYMGPALNIDGRTPLPIAADNMTLLIVAGYVCSILTMCLAPGSIIPLSRVSTAVALVAALGLFLPLGETGLRLCIYAQCFCCCYMIGFESATMVHYLTQGTVLRHLLVAYPIGYVLVALIQNDFFAIPFSVFRILSVAMLMALLIFYGSIPSNHGIEFVKKEDRLVRPKRFLTGFLLLAFLGALLGVIAPAAAAEVEHGIFVACLGCSVGSFGLYVLYKKTGLHPICLVPYVIGLSAIGYVLLVVTQYLPGLSLVACALIGMGMAVCALLPLFALLVVGQYPSKFIVPGYIGLAMLAVVVQSVLVEAFRNSAVLLNLAYLVVVIIMAILYVLVEPYLLYSLRRRYEDPAEPATLTTPEPASAEAPEETPAEIPSTEASLLEQLTPREREVANLICAGHSNTDIAQLLVLSQHTVKDHTKNIYRKLEVHSRFELAARLSGMRELP